jgi:hypothetical protein
VIATNRPDNAIGWVFLAMGIVLGATNAATSYADYGLFAVSEPLPAAEWAAWTVAWLRDLFLLCLVLILLLFPDGRLASRRWRPVLWALVASAVAMTAGTAIKHGIVFESLPVENPAGVRDLEPWPEVVATAGFLLSAVVVVLAVGGAVVRFRRARGVERQQFKWFALSACLLPAAILLTALTSVGFPRALAVGLVGIAFAGIIVAVAIAILRYRLYDVDRLISRTLVYGALTIVLGAAYAGLVLAGQGVFSSFAGGSDLAIAGSTLVVAALFLPLRARVQRFVDRRFYRRRYDALEAFGARLREQTDLEALQSDLRDVVHETVQPATAAVWLRGTS